MSWADRLGELTDARTIERGRAYADGGRVAGLVEDGDRLTALVRGTEDYRVELVAGSMSWFCDCPVGASGAFCKHCVAVAIAAAGGGTEPGPADLSEFEPRPGRADDLTVLADEVARAFTPRRRFYDYDQANAYADAAEATVGLVEEWSRRAPSAELLPIVQDAIDRAARTILRSDDSSGGQGMQIGRLLDAHLRTAAATSLDRKAAATTARWLFRFMFTGTQDFFTVDIDRYAAGLGPDGVNVYRRMLERVDDGTHASAGRYARGRLAILSRDSEQIRAHFGGELTHPIHVEDLVDALETAGHGELALEHARDAVAAHPRSPFIGSLVERLVADARRRGADDEVAVLRRDDFHHRPSTTSYAALEHAATAAGSWDVERVRADPVLAAADPPGWVSTLLGQGDAAAAWAAAESVPERIGLDLWRRLFRARVRIDPASTLPHYRRLVEASVVTADRRSYQVATRLLRSMREAAAKADRSAEFDTYLADLRDRYRRRRALEEELRRGGL
ncbi:SWIM zinc finger family protein [Jiangella alkaliphila]|uniref:SWIM zinc finger n=1 Tax=Jiangella alkaliphila TaxID=419479 RepID=A0A1H2HT93_9ACTN|nr:SWIM zinc finger family protein [Jiangella alkaliphila]SDU35072.1 SWIM zinc finger [Jiangella alkaliphila]